MSAELLRRAATLMREDSKREAILRDGDPYYATEASVFEKHMTPTVALAVADWLDLMAAGIDRTWTGLPESSLPEPYIAAVIVARAYLDES